MSSMVGALTSAAQLAATGRPSFVMCDVDASAIGSTGSIGSSAGAFGDSASSSSSSFLDEGEGLMGFLGSSWGVVDEWTA
jgi:hypothetical protein